MRVLLVWLGVSSQCAGPHPAHAIVPNRIVAIVRIVHVGVEDGVHGKDTNPGDQAAATVSLATGADPAFSLATKGRLKPNAESGNSGLMTAPG